MGVLPQSRPAGLPGLAHRGRLDIRLNHANHIHAPCRCGIGPDSLLCAAHFRDWSVAWNVGACFVPLLAGVGSWLHHASASRS
jgi:hypothetical protein